MNQNEIKYIQLTGDGNFHVLLMVRADVLEDVHEAHRLAGDIATAAIEMGGTCTGEHGK
jgi:D-lactate dehydrogenase (cytochrome)